MTTVTVNTKADYAALLLRVTMGIFFLAHAALKIFVFTPAGAAGFFASLGVPGWLAYPVMLLEVVGGIALVLGYYGRWLAIPLALDLLGAIVLVHGPAGFFFTNPHGGWEYLALWIVGLVALFLLGDGAYALKREARN
ncbi:DoxX family protein [Herbaspirillum sp. WKF16]|jgi:putative oxidoreductase|uniref:DoxX family protein n=1 Tax=Herbaspirillum sp. WKF16 TaxID=3028312 RepID=UPI0023A9BFBA|nr:DoxX family protein [Herbaspirillum sp. WKF16]WDZ96770.1 DoxX family protein [Herbaspirillum sp. WKF16]